MLKVLLASVLQLFIVQSLAAQLDALPPIPAQKPIIDPTLYSNEEPEISEEERYRPYLLFEGGIGDQAAGEGVVILGPSGNDLPLSLDLLETLGIGETEGLELTIDSKCELISEVLDESPAAREICARRAALSDLMKRQAAISLEVARVRALDKVTGEISEFMLSINEEIEFGDLRIKARTCQKSPPGEPKERAAFLQIRDVRQPDAGDKNGNIFSGWMLASNPSISALDHPVYDVWVVDCKKA